MGNQQKQQLQQTKHTFSGAILHTERLVMFTKVPRTRGFRDSKIIRWDPGPRGEQGHFMQIYMVIFTDIP